MNKKQGFTLVELIVAIGLMTMLVAILATILESAQEMYDMARIRANIEANGRNAIETLENDMSRLIPLSNDFQRYEFFMRSKPWDTSRDNIETEKLSYLNTDKPKVEDENGGPIQDDCVLMFYASTDFYDSEEGINKYKVCRIKYYMKRRKDMTFKDEKSMSRPGSYLIRRIEPYEYVTDSDGNVSVRWLDPIEEDICSYVRGVRLWYYERDASVSDKDIKFIEATKSEDTIGNPLPDDDLWDDNNSCVKFKMQEDWVSSDESFEQQHFLPPAIMFEVHVIDDTASAYRVIRKIINIPIAPVVIPKKPNQQ